ncbi:HPr family phosphocarrier protein [Devosia sp.]|uniref:HPr family phosphocarrier protein n=1 Tax=Devosia sp. TaxID=1871048 RepID=UPI0019F073A3|nr:HPr family phosphocarrier protein [Devosia sp.]MBE0578904.1 HPr family phosphocarrier protein [Devosia sp.]
MSAQPSDRVEARVVINHDVGLHARPSVKLTKLAKAFRARVELAIGDGGDWVDAKSIVKVMATKAPKGAVMLVRAEGQDARDAVAALIALVERDFDEGGVHAVAP